MFGKDKKRPSSADGERPTSSKFVRPCYVESSRAASADSGSASSSRRSTPRSRRPSADKKPTEPSKFVGPCSADGSSRSPTDYSGSGKSSRPSSPPKRRPKKPRAFSTNSSPKASRDASPKSSSPPCSASAGASLKSSRDGSRASSPMSGSSAFRRWGSPYPPNSKNSTKPCSPDYTVVSLEDSGSLFPEHRREIKTKCPRGRSSPELPLKFAGDTNPAAKRLMQVMVCASAARAPFPEAKVRRLVFYKNTDKENLIDELQSLKTAAADQKYHFELHKSHLHGLQTEHDALEAKIAGLESINGSNAPRTGGKGRLISKISGMRVMIGNLTDDVTKHKETIQNLKYRYQVCLAREITIQRDMAAGDVWRLQKQVRNTRDVLKALTAHNKKFLHLRDKILPDLRERLKINQEIFKEAKLAIKEVEKVSKQFTDDSYAHLRAADKAKRRASGLLDECKRLKAKLKQEREIKRKNQQDVWIIGYETRTLVKENKRIERAKKLKEMEMAEKGGLKNREEKRVIRSVGKLPHGPMRVDNLCSPSAKP